jgi:putative intracellular protease/amidase
MARGTDDNDKPTFVVRDRNYVSARWPGDSYRIARELLAMLDEKMKEAA